jgi:hypothetical protein
MFITSFCGFTVSFKLILTVMQYNVTKFIMQFCGLFPSTGEGVRKQEMEGEGGGEGLLCVQTGRKSCNIALYHLGSSREQLL